MAKKPRTNNSVKYAGLGFQLVAITLVLIFSGKALDNYLNLESVFLFVAVFIAVFAVIFVLIKSLN
jgi:F0F1-type ATP synthase assembly protein I